MFAYKAKSSINRTNKNNMLIPKIIQSKNQRQFMNFLNASKLKFITKITDMIAYHENLY